MDSLTELALTADVTGAATAAVRAGVAEAQRQARRIIGLNRPIQDAGHARASHVDPAQQLAWQLVCLRIELTAGWEPIQTVVSLRRFGATWAMIGAAAGMTRQSAHERWNAGTLALLDRHGTGEWGGAVADDVPVGW